MTMRQILAIVLLLAAATGSATAGMITVDFSVFGLPPDNPTGIGAQNITTTPTITRLTGASGMTFQYMADPNAFDPAVPGMAGACAFDGATGTQWSPGCVGADVSMSGVYGTTDGSYLFGFGLGAWEVQFSFAISSVLDPLPLSTDFLVQGLFYNGVSQNGAIEFTDQDMTCAAGSCSGVFDYRGPAFTWAEVYFAPAGQILTDPGTGQPLGHTFGQNILALDTVVYDAVPEPGTLTLWAIALLGLGVVRRVVLKKL
jgi:hypothetical protein